MGYRKIYVLHRVLSNPAQVYHENAFGGMGYGNIEDASFAIRFDIIAMDEKTVTVQSKDETV